MCGRLDIGLQSFVMLYILQNPGPFHMLISAHVYHYPEERVTKSITKTLSFLCWGYSSVVECLPSVREAVGLILNRRRGREERRDGRRKGGEGKGRKGRGGGRRKLSCAAQSDHLVRAQLQLKPEPPHYCSFLLSTHSHSPSPLLSLFGFFREFNLDG